MALGMMVEGEWVNHRRQEDSEGRFIRTPTTFRYWVTADGSSGFPAEEGRYHLYVCMACPWAHRALIMRKLKGLEDAISVSVVDPYMGDGGWAFSGEYPDHVNGASYLREVYAKADPRYTGRVTVPVLWDKREGTIVNNESRELIRMLDTEFEPLARRDADLCPEDLREEIDRVIDEIYSPINNGVYRSGFATTQEAYEQAVTELFDALDHWEGVLSRQRYLCGERMTEADVCMFTTLLRFDPVYYSHFKCNLRRIMDYPNLWGYLRDIYQQPGVAETCDLGEIKYHYYASHESINPTRIVPKGPVIDLEAAHGREKLAGSVA
jgi:putative glutathione S-transferase